MNYPSMRAYVPEVPDWAGNGADYHSLFVVVGGQHHDAAHHLHLHAPRQQTQLGHLDLRTKGIPNLVINVETWNIIVIKLYEMVK